MLEGSFRTNLSLSQEMLTQQFEAELKNISFGTGRNFIISLCRRQRMWPSPPLKRWLNEPRWVCARKLFLLANSHSMRVLHLIIPAEFKKESTVRKYKRKKYSFSASKIQDEISMPGELMFLWQSFPDISGIIFAWCSRNDYGVLQLSRLSSWKRIFWSNS